jgi:uncharacterized protein YbjT (DUF2867 family)
MTVDILVTGANGRTGKYIVEGFVKAGRALRVFTRSAEHGQKLIEAGAAEAVEGDLSSEADVARAMDGVKFVYHIPPNMNPKEIEFGKRLVEGAVAAGIEHFVYHSVLHPGLQGLPHHWNKLFVEEALIESGLNFSILQPSSYMQNTAMDWDRITNQGIHAMAFKANVLMSLVDLQDIGEIAAMITGNPDHYSAVYQMAGPAALSTIDKAAILSKELGREVRGEQEPIEKWRAAAKASGIPDHVIAGREKMFAHYDEGGLAGNGQVMNFLLGRPATTFAEYVRRTIKEQSG